MQTGKITYLTNTLENSAPFACQSCKGAPQLRIPLSLRTTKQLRRCFVAKLRNATGSRMSGFRLLAIEDLGFSLIPRQWLNEYSTAELNVYDKRLTNKSRWSLPLNSKMKWFLNPVVCFSFPSLSIASEVYKHVLFYLLQPASISCYYRWLCWHIRNWSRHRSRAICQRPNMSTRSNKQVHTTICEWYTSKYGYIRVIFGYIRVHKVIICQFFSLYIALKLSGSARTICQMRGRANPRG